MRAFRIPAAASSADHHALREPLPRKRIYLAEEDPGFSFTVHTGGRKIHRSVIIKKQGRVNSPLIYPGRLRPSFFHIRGMYNKIPFT